MKKRSNNEQNRDYRFRAVRTLAHNSSSCFTCDDEHAVTIAICGGVISLTICIECAKELAHVVIEESIGEL